MKLAPWRFSEMNLGDSVYVQRSAANQSVAVPKCRLFGDHSPLHAGRINRFILLAPRRSDLYFRFSSIDPEGPAHFWGLAYCGWFDPSCSGAHEVSGRIL